MRRLWLLLGLALLAPPSASAREAVTLVPLWDAIYTGQPAWHRVTFETPVPGGLEPGRYTLSFRWAAERRVRIAHWAVLDLESGIVLAQGERPGPFQATECIEVDVPADPGCAVLAFGVWISPPVSNTGINLLSAVTLRPFPSIVVEAN